MYGVQITAPCQVYIWWQKTMKKSTYFPSRTENGHSTFTRKNLHLYWPSMPVLVPHRIRRKLRSTLRSRQSPSSSLASLQTSLSPSDTLRSLRSHRWSYYDGQYLILIILGVFMLAINPAGPLIKTGAAALLMLLLILPLTRQFFLPFLPIGTWLVFFFNCR